MKPIDLMNIDSVNLFDNGIKCVAVDPSTLLFDANCGRIGIIQVMNAACFFCGTEIECLHIDQSEGEYSAAVICKSCIHKLFDKKIK